MDSATSTKPPNVLYQLLNYGHLLKMEHAPRSRPNLIHAWDPSLIQGIDLLTTRNTCVNVLKEMLMLTEAFGMYFVLDPIDGNVASCVH